MRTQRPRRRTVGTVKRTVYHGTPDVPPIPFHPPMPPKDGTPATPTTRKRLHTADIAAIMADPSTQHVGDAAYAPLPDTPVYSIED